MASATISAKPAGKHMKWDNVDEDADVPSDGEPVGEEFMKGDLADDLHSFIKTLQLPSTVPEGKKKDAKPKSKKPVDPPKKAAEPPASTKPEKRAHKDKGKDAASTTKPPKHERFSVDEDKLKPTPDLKGKGKAVDVTPKHIKFAADDSKPARPEKKRKLLVQPMPHWYTAVPPLEPLDSIPQLSPSDIQKLTTKAEDLLKDEALTADASSSTSASDKAFLSQILTAGTSSDRLSALTLTAQGSPLHNQRALEGLKTMASKKGGREESLKALRAIVDLWVGGAAPERKLRYFVDQPLGHPGVNDQHLVLWAFEDWFKKYFFSLLQILERLSLDTLPYIRTQAAALIFILLKDRPEQEQNLLRLLVNKLGDGEKSVASKASYYILQLLQAHPSMKAVVVREISSLILRPAATLTLQHARYYGVLTFTQVTLTAKEKEVAQLLVTLYFELFVMILGSAEADGDRSIEKKQGDGESSKAKADSSKTKTGGAKSKGKNDKGGAGFVEAEDGISKLIAAILTGVNRALPFARMEETIFDEHIDTLFRITHTATFNVSIQALVLISHIASARPAITDRYYRTLYESMLDPRLAISSKQAMYLNLLFKAAKSDDSYPRLCAFTKRFLQALSMHQLGFICGALFLLGEVFETRPELRKLAEMKAEDDEEEDAEEPEAGPSTSTYDPKKRDPRLANAEHAPLWEIVPLLHHFHPSVALYAHQLLNGEKVDTTADLSLHTVSSFLDRFIAKTPKKLAPKGSSVMQPGTAQDGSVLVRQLRGIGSKFIEEKTLKQKLAADVPVDQLFFHKFLNLQRKPKSKKKPTKKSKDEDDLVAASSDDDDEGGPEKAGESETDEEEEAKIWEAMKKSIPDAAELPDDSDEDEDDIPSDLDAMESEVDEDEEGDGEVFGGMLEDEDDIIDSDDLAAGLEAESGEDDDWGGVVGTKRKKNSEDEGGKKKRKKTGGLPTFASYDDYAKMIDADSDEDM